MENSSTQAQNTSSDMASVDQSADQQDLANTVMVPAPTGETGGETVVLQSGTTYIFDFAESDVETYQQDGDSLKMVLTSGQEIVLGNFAQATSGEKPAVISFKDSVAEDVLAAVIEMQENMPEEEELEEPASEIRIEAAEAVSETAEPADDNAEMTIVTSDDMAEQLAEIMPSAGETDIAEQLAQIEPAAGEGAVAGGRGGFGFESTFRATPLNSPDAVGPIDPTALQYGIPQVQDDVFPEDDADAAPVDPLNPEIEAPNQVIVEDKAEQLVFNITPESPNSLLDITITGIPAGWTVTGPGAFDSGTGTWTFSTTTPGDSFTDGPILQPPGDSDVDLPGLQIEVTETDTVTGNTGTQTTTFDVITDAEADAPDLNANGSTVDEGSAASITINTSLTDTDGSEEITSIVVTGVPSGFTLSAGTPGANPGEFVLTQAELAGLTISAPKYYSGSITLGVISTSEEVNTSDNEPDLTNNTADSTADLVVTWTPVADAPELIVDNAQVKEDGSVDIPVEAKLADTDGSEFLTVTVKGIPASWGFAGAGWVQTGAETYEVTVPEGQDYAGSFTLTPPADSDVDLDDIEVTATSTEVDNNDSASTSKMIDVFVDAEYDDPRVSGQDNAGLEGTPLDVDISGAAGDIDGSEVIVKYQIELPAGHTDFTFNKGTDLGGGVWEFTPAEITGLTITPNNADFVGSIDPKVIVFTTETPDDVEYDTTDNTAQADDIFELTWRPDANPPTVKVNNGVDDAWVKEDGSVDVPIEAALDPNGSGNETLTVTVTGIDSSWGFSAPIGTYNAGAGTWTVTLPAGQNLASTNMTFTPPADTDIDLTGLSATATAYEPSTDTTASSGPDGFNVNVDAVVDDFTLNAGNASGDEGTTIPLTITLNAPGDVDGSESVTLITITGLPTGATLNNFQSESGGVWTLSESDLTGLALNVPNGQAGDYVLTVSTTVSEKVEATDAPGNKEDDFSDNTLTKTDTINLTVGQDDEPQIRDDVASVDETNMSPTTSVSDKIDVDFGNDTPGTISGSGSYTLNGLTSAGNAVSVAYNAATSTYTGTAGGQQIFTLVIGNDGSYTFTLTGPVDHADTTDHNDSLAINFGVEAKDVDGDVQTGTITINIFDDGPVANDDFNTYDTNAGQTDGNVISGLNGGAGAQDDLSEDVDNTVINVNFGGTDYAIPAGGSSLIEGEFGVLEMFSDGTYTYTLKADAPDLSQLSFNETLLYPKTGGDKIQGDELNNLGLADSVLDMSGETSGTVEFISKEAGYHNTLGMYTVAADGTLQAAQIIVENINDAIAGQQITSFDAESQESIAFFIIADGSRKNGGYNNIDLNAGTLEFVYDYGGAGERTALISDDGSMVKLVYTETLTGTETVLKGAVYHTTERGSTDNLNPDGTVRTISGLAQDGNDEILRIGFEDLPGLGDQDYDDVVFDITISNECLTDEFVYTLQDEDGDTDTAILQFNGKDLDGDVSLLKVGQNVDDQDPSSTPYLVGEGSGDIVGATENDVLIGDAGGSQIVQQGDANIALVLDVSGSMLTDKVDRLSVLKNSVNKAIDDIQGYINDTGASVAVRFIPFSDYEMEGASYVFGPQTSVADFDAAKQYVNALTDFGSTNYESPLASAIDWFNSTNVENGINPPLTNAANHTLFITDGLPNFLIGDNGQGIHASDDQHVIDHLTGVADGSNEIADIQALSNVKAIGIETPNNPVLDMIDSSGTAVSISDASQLEFELERSNPVNKLSAAGDDVIYGDDGDDVILGDVLNTDALIAANNINLPEGAGWQVIEIMEADYGWSRADTFNFIFDQALLNDLGGESLDGFGQGRIGGNDVLYGGSGNDVIFGQEGNDIINGGAGSDILSGGSGSDVFVFTNDDAVDTVLDFDTSEDQLDVSDLIAGYDPLQDSINDFVFATEAGGNTTISVDASGSGDVNNATAIATLQGVTGVSVEDVTGNGSALV